MGRTALRPRRLSANLRRESHEASVDGYLIAGLTFLCCLAFGLVSCKRCLERRQAERHKIAVSYAPDRPNRKLVAARRRARGAAVRTDSRRPRLTGPGALQRTLQAVATGSAHGGYRASQLRVLGRFFKGRLPGALAETADAVLPYAGPYAATWHNAPAAACVAVVGEDVTLLAKLIDSGECDVDGRSPIGTTLLQVRDRRCRCRCQSPHWSPTHASRSLSPFIPSPSAARDRASEIRRCGPAPSSRRGREPAADPAAAPGRNERSRRGARGPGGPSGAGRRRDPSTRPGGDQEDAE